MRGFPGAPPERGAPAGAAMLAVVTVLFLCAAAAAAGVLAICRENR